MGVPEILGYIPAVLVILLPPVNIKPGTVKLVEPVIEYLDVHVGRSDKVREPDPSVYYLGVLARLLPVSVTCKLAILGHHLGVRNGIELVHVPHGLLLLDVLDHRHWINADPVTYDRSPNVSHYLGCHLGGVHEQGGTGGTTYVLVKLVPVVIRPVVEVIKVIGGYYTILYRVDVCV